MLSRRYRPIETYEILNGALTPTPGRISTLPSIRGYPNVHDEKHISNWRIRLSNLFSDVVNPDCKRKMSGLEVCFSHTSVAAIPGYPTRKLLFGGPLTLTRAVISQVNCVNTIRQYRQFVLVHLKIVKLNRAQYRYRLQVVDEF